MASEGFGNETFPWFWTHLSCERKALDWRADASESDHAAGKRLETVGWEARNLILSVFDERGEFLGREVRPFDLSVKPGTSTVDGRQLAEAAAPLGDVRRISTFNHGIEGSFIAQLPSEFLARLTDLSMAFQMPSLEDVASLSMAPMLVDLEAPLSDDHASAVSGLQSLKSLKSYSGDVSDEFFRSLGPLPNLEILDISSLAVGDAAVEQLGKFPSLKLLRLFRTGVRERGVRLLPQVLPNSALVVGLPADQSLDSAATELQRVRPSLQVLRRSDW